MATKLLITVDTEENWEGPGSDKKPDVGNIYKLPEMQKDCFDRLNIRPVYLVTYPVVTDQRCVALLKEVRDSGRCEIGGHLHQWDVPPYTEKDVLEKSVQCRLPRDVEKSKTELLTDKIEKEFGLRPVTFRAGRWGADAETINILAELGYKVDLSVTPLIDYRSEGGVDFFDAPFDAYFPSSSDITVPTTEEGRAVLEIPVTCGFNSADFDKARSFYKFAKKMPECMHFLGLLYRMNILKRIKLSPEAATLSEMKKLVDICIARQCEVLHLTFHSSMNSAGDSPYSRTKEETDMRKDALRGILEYISKIKKIGSMTASEIYEKRRK